MTGDLIPVEGAVRPHTNLRISKFSQHFVDVLDLTKAPLDYFMELWPDMTRDDCRRWLGRYGLSGAVQTQVMEQLSDGQKSRTVLAKIAKEAPHILFLDEPTNHLDMESIDSLARAINCFEGGLVLVSHDMRLISQVAKEIWICDHRKVERFAGEISDFKMRIRTGLGLSNPSAKSVSVPKAPLAPVPIAPPQPPKASTADVESDAVMKARLELAELAIEKQRARKKAEAEGVAPSDATDDVKQADSEVVTSVDSTADGLEKQPVEKPLTERELKKLKKEAEKKAALERKAEMEAEKERRRLEKIKDLEEATALREAEDKARAERQKEREEKAAKKKAEEEEAAAELAAAKQKRQEEKEARRRERELQREIENERRRKEWEASARADPWTQEQQALLEEALILWNPFTADTKSDSSFEKSVLSPPEHYNFVSAEHEKIMKWTYVANAVPGKSRNQCLSRYKFLKQIVAEAKEQKKQMSADSIL